MSDDHRLERIENKLDSMSEAIVALARMEERMITLFKRMDTLDGEQSAQARRLSLVENRVGSNGQSLRFAERLFWIIATAAVGLIFFKMRSGG
tara:strand:- start:1375 stop:1653 length:279 start_codon:yes stop_codon:yes gene_type:complete